MKPETLFFHMIDMILMSFLFILCPGRVLMFIQPALMVPEQKVCSEARNNRYQPAEQQKGPTVKGELTDQTIMSGHKRNPGLSFHLSEGDKLVR